VRDAILRKIRAVRDLRSAGMVSGSSRRVAMVGSFFAAVGAVTVVACGSAPQEDVGSALDALTCGPAEGDWSDFPAGGTPSDPQQCVGGVREFFHNRYGIWPPATSGAYGNCALTGACNMWVNPIDNPDPSVWERIPWGTETAETYDMVVFPPIAGDAYGHIAVVDHMSGGTLYVMDSHYGGAYTKAACVHTVPGWTPYGVFRLKELAAKPVTGSLDGATCQAIGGWAEDPGSVGAAISVELYADGPRGTGTLLGTVTAGTSRPDLCSALGSCDHAFSVAPPASLYDGREHSIYAYGIHVMPGASDALLSNAPLSVHCGAAVTGDFHGTGRAEVVQFRDDWTTLPSCGRTASGWSCRQDDATYVGGAGAGNKGSAVYAGSTALVGDMNGDGRDDVLEWNGAGTSIPVCFSVDHGWSCENLPARYVGGLGAGNGGSGVYPGATAFVADVNADGKADVVQYVPGAESIPVCFATDDGWACENLAATYVGGATAGNGGSGVFGAPNDGTTAFVADVNGDGKADLVQYNPAWSTIPVCFATLHGWACENLSADYVGGTKAGNAGSGVYAGAVALVADVNGDGKADLVQYDPAGTALPLCVSTGHGWSCESLEATYVGGLGAGNGGSGVYPGATLVLADVNGDGHADLVEYAAGVAGIPVCFSTPHGWSCENLAVGMSGAAGATAGLPAGSTLVASFRGGAARSIVQLAPESQATTLPLCELASPGWSCTSDAATVF
jgi:hypothetical protein